MPTREAYDTFFRDWKGLTPEQIVRFLKAVAEFAEDLDRDGLPRAGLRVKRVQGTDDVWELTWAPDGRATFEYGKEILPGKRHVAWRRIGTHAILDTP